MRGRCPVMETHRLDGRREAVALTDMSKDDASKESRLASSWLGRSVLTAALAAEIAARLAAGPLRRLLASPDRAKQLSESNHEAIARRLLGKLGQLKGAAMKLGQMA